MPPFNSGGRPGEALLPLRQVGVGSVRKGPGSKATQGGRSERAREPGTPPREAWVPRSYSSLDVHSPTGCCWEGSFWLLLPFALSQKEQTEAWAGKWGA